MRWVKPFQLPGCFTLPGKVLEVRKEKQKEAVVKGSRVVWKEKFEVEK